MTSPRNSTKTPASIACKRDANSVQGPAGTGPIGRRESVTASVTNLRAGKLRGPNRRVRMDLATRQDSKKALANPLHPAGADSSPHLEVPA